MFCFVLFCFFYMPGVSVVGHDYTMYYMYIQLYDYTIIQLYDIIIIYNRGELFYNYSSSILNSSCLSLIVLI